MLGVFLDLSKAFDTVKKSKFMVSKALILPGSVAGLQF